MSKVQPEPTQRTERVKVTEEDYAEALRANQYQCAIAQAIQRTNPNATNIRVNKKSIGWTEGEARFTYPTPEVAIEEIIRPFDTGSGELKPITLRLTGGYVRPVQHQEDDTLLRHRTYNRRYRRNRLRISQDSAQPAASTFERFPANG